MSVKKRKYSKQFQEKYKSALDILNIKNTDLINDKLWRTDLKLPRNPNTLGKWRKDGPPRQYPWVSENGNFKETIYDVHSLITQYFIAKIEEWTYPKVCIDEDLFTNIEVSIEQFRAELRAVSSEKHNFSKSEETKWKEVEDNAESKEPNSLKGKTERCLEEGLVEFTGNNTPLSTQEKISIDDEQNYVNPFKENEPLKNKQAHDSVESSTSQPDQDQPPDAFVATGTKPNLKKTILYGLIVLFGLCFIVFMVASQLYESHLQNPTKSTLKSVDRQSIPEIQNPTNIINIYNTIINQETPKVDYEEALIKLATKYGVQKQAIIQFFKTVGKMDIKEEDIPLKFSEIAKQHLELIERLKNYKIDDPDLNTLKTNALKFAESGLYKKADQLLIQYEELYLKKSVEYRKTLKDIDFKVAENKANRAEIKIIEANFLVAANLFEEAYNIVSKHFAQNNEMISDAELMGIQYATHSGAFYAYAGEVHSAKEIFRKALIIIGDNSPFSIWAQGYLWGMDAIEGKLKIDLFDVYSKTIETLSKTTETLIDVGVGKEIFDPIFLNQIRFFIKLNLLGESKQIASAYTLGVLGAEQLNPSARTAEIYFDIGEIYAFRNQIEIAKQLFERSFRLYQIVGVDKKRLSEIEENINQALSPDRITLNTIENDLIAVKVIVEIIKNIYSVQSSGYFYEMLDVVEYLMSTNFESSYAHNLLDETSKLFDKFSGKNKEDLAVLNSDLGYQYYLKGDYENALYRYEKAIKLYSEVDEIQRKDITPLLPFYNKIVILKKLDADKQQILIVFNQATTIFKKIKIGENIFGYLLYAISEYLIEIGDYDNAEKNCLHALELLKKDRIKAGETNIDQVLYSLGRIYFEKKKYTEAIEYYKQSLAYKERKTLSNKEHTQLNLEIAKCYHKLGDHDKVDDYLEKASNIQIYAIALDHGLYGEILSFLARVYEDRGEQQYAEYVENLSKKHIAFQNILDDTYYREAILQMWLE